MLSEDPVARGMGGNAIRALELARVLSAHAAVTLASPAADDYELGDIERAAFDREDPRRLRSLLRGTDVVLALPAGPVVARELLRSGARVIYDLYDPKPLQVLEAFATASAFRRRYWARLALDHVLAALCSGDHLICASERQRDLWIGAMLALGLITPATYASDPDLRGLIDVVPFGVPTHAPAGDADAPFERFPGLSRPAQLVLWNGGLWNWLDPVSAVEAIARVVVDRPEARLVFMGPAPLEPSQAAAAREASAKAQQLGILDRIVFFNGERVPYDERDAWLLAADCALSLHLEHLETRFSFRTRLLDCFWASLPVVCTHGDELAERVAGDGLGATVPAGDVSAAADAIVAVLAAGRDGYRDAFGRVVSDYRWPQVAAPLLRFIADGASARRRRARPTAPAALRLRAGGTRLARAGLRAMRRLS